MVRAESIQMIESARRLFASLLSLRTFRPTDSASLKAWYAKANELVLMIRGDQELCDLVPIRIWQYLSDADMRLEESCYAEAQDILLRKYLSALERGEFLTGEELDRELDPGSRSFD